MGDLGVDTPCDPTSNRTDGEGAEARRVVDHRPSHPYVSWRTSTLVKKARTREAAARLLARATIKSVTLRDVSLAAGLTKGSAYYYYGSRDALLADTLTEHLVALNQAVCVAFDATEASPAPDRMIALAHAFLRVVLRQRNAHLALRLNTRLLSEARRSRVIARSQQVMATMRTALLECVPGLEAKPAIAGLLMRQLVGGLSEAVTWFKPEERTDGGLDGRIDTVGLAQLMTSQALMTARAMVEGEWVLPPPASSPLGAEEPEPAEAGVPVEAVVPVAEEAVRGVAAEAPAGQVAAGVAVAEEAEPASEPPRDAIWLTAERARRSLPRLVRAAGGGTEVVLTHRGVPAAKLVAATRERQRMRGLVSGRSG